MTLYLTTLSFEERCLALAEDLPHASPGDSFAVIDFSGYENVSPYLFNRVKLLRALESKEFAYRIVEAQTKQPLRARAHLEGVLEDLGADRVVVDISTMPKNFLFATLHILALSGVPTWIRYYRPKLYGKDLSHGVRSIQAIPGFEGDVGPAGETVLGVILGFEGYKSLHAWERVGPSKVVAFVGDPPYEQGLLERSKDSNKEFLERIAGVTQISLHTHDPFKAKIQLQEAYNDLRSNGIISFVLCPLGTKLQSLAAFAFAVNNREVSVAYVSSLRYFTEDYSRGWQQEYVEIDLGQLLGT